MHAKAPMLEPRLRISRYGGLILICENYTIDANRSGDERRDPGMGLFGKKKTKSDREIYLESLSKTYQKILHKDAILETVNNLMPGESIVIVIQGLWDSAIIATEHRVFIYKRGMMGGAMGGSKLITWDMDVIHGVQMEFGKNTGFISLQTPNATVADMSYWATDATSPQKAPNAIAINKPLKNQANIGVIQLRTLLFQRKHISTSD